jgi:uncharacterized NAD(P)/FAD-binding protein YdhS
MTEPGGRLAIIIVGGGASGVLLAAHLLRDPDADIRVTLIEKRRAFGQGIAYSTTLDEHVLNVSAFGMSAYADDPEHFWRWLQLQDAPTDRNPRKTYVPRHIYADYLAGVLDGLRQAEGSNGRLHTVSEECVSVATTAAGVDVRLANGTSLIGHVAVLAVGHEEQAISGKDVAMRPGSATDTPLGPDATVLILGTGLSMVDAWISLAARGHRGRTVALSRRGLISSVHRKGKPIRLDSADVPLGTDLSYFLRWFRNLVRETERAGGDWRDVVDGIRPFNQRIWRSWPPGARRRFIEHTRAWWDVHRHRMPPALHERVSHAVADGTLQPVAGKLVGAVRDGDLIRATIRRRGAATTETLNVARIYDCTGITSDLAAASNPIVRALIDRGLARPDPLRIGLDVTEACAIVKTDGQPSERLYAIGPLTRGAFFEIDAIPDIRVQCAMLAKRLTARAGQVAQAG